MSSVTALARCLATGLLCVASSASADPAPPPSAPPLSNERWPDEVLPPGVLVPLTPPAWPAWSPRARPRDTSALAGGIVLTILGGTGLVAAPLLALSGALVDLNAAWTTCCGEGDGAGDGLYVSAGVSAALGAAVLPGGIYLLSRKERRDFVGVKPWIHLPTSRRDATSLGVEVAF